MTLDECDRIRKPYAQGKSPAQVLGDDLRAIIDITGSWHQVFCDPDRLSMRYNRPAMQQGAVSIDETPDTHLRRCFQHSERAEHIGLDKDLSEQVAICV